MVYHILQKDSTGIIKDCGLNFVSMGIQHMGICLVCFYAVLVFKIVIFNVYKGRTALVSFLH